MLILSFLCSSGQAFTIFPNYTAFEAVDDVEPPLPAEEREMYRQFGRFSLAMYMFVAYILLSNLLIAIMARRYR